MDRFSFNGVDLPVFDHDYNRTADNERGVEISVAMWWLNQHGHGRGLEVGNVLSHYFPEVLPERRVVDKYEAADYVEPLDVFDVKGEFDYIFAISTLEHVRWDEPEPRELGGSVDAFNHLATLLAPGGHMLVTVPFGSNPGLDYAILAGAFDHGRQTVLMRGGGLWHENSNTGRWECRGSAWYQAETIWWVQYGKSTPWADAVWIGEFER